MGARARAKREIGAVELPDDVWAVFSHFKTEEVMANLNEQGEQDFTTEVLGALRESITNNDVRPLQEVLESWYQTLVVLRDPSFGPKFEWAEKTPLDPKNGHPVKDLKKALGL